MTPLGIVIMWTFLALVGLVIFFYFSPGLGKWKLVKPYPVGKSLFKKRYPLNLNKAGFYPVTQDSLGHLLCPICGGSGWIEGPEGGASQNLQCSSCFEYFNYMGPFGFHKLDDRSHIFGKPKPAPYGEEQI